MVRFIEDTERQEFPDDVIELAWDTAGKRCKHCGKKLEWKNHGRENDDWWEAHHADGNPKNISQENCQILCYGCHKETDSFGKPKTNRPTRLGVKFSN